jgi:hypothetical protein
MLVMLTIDDIDEHDKVKVSEYDDSEYDGTVSYVGRVVDIRQGDKENVIRVWVIEMIEPSSFSSRCDIKRKGESRGIGIKNIKEILEKEAYID